MKITIISNTTPINGTDLLNPVQKSFASDVTFGGATSANIASMLQLLSDMKDLLTDIKAQLVQVNAYLIDPDQNGHNDRVSLSNILNGYYNVANGKVQTHNS